MTHPKDLPQLRNWSPIVTARGVFTGVECEMIKSLRDEPRDGTLQYQDQQGGNYRKSRVSWIRPEESNTWIFSKAYEMVRQANERSFQMELSGFTEPLQVAEYTDEGHYDWHLDIGNGPLSIRKLSFIVQLTDPTEYQGGEVELLYSREAKAAPKERGCMTLFPSYMLHRVRSVTQGTRFSLVGWIGGPHYR